ncbi:MAG: class I SAM-dependent methyltransferase [Campylobacteraceae bacterium]|jgi:hypothetical protein|nr:class I SAM-dependent methyltransferase [Campylobacteraceae bacterium]
MKCKICGTNNKYIFSAKILNKYNIKYFLCPNCGFLQTEEPYWIEEAYKNSINLSDTGYIQRNINLSKKVSILLRLLFCEYNKNYLDYAGGYGIFVRLMRDMGFNFYWSDKYTDNIFAKGFEYNDADTLKAVTTFESFEHFINPMNEIEKILLLSKNIIFTTELLPSIVPKSDQWWYYGLEHGQHVSFYQQKTMHFIAAYYKINYYNFNSLQLFTDKYIYFPLLISIVLKFTKFDFNEIFKIGLKSKTVSDNLEISKKANNENIL